MSFICTRVQQFSPSKAGLTLKARLYAPRLLGHQTCLIAQRNSITSILTLRMTVSTMRAYRYDNTGGLDQLRLREVPKPVLEPGEALVKVKASGVNLSDVVGICGWLPFVTTPRVPGRDYAGIVEAVRDQHDDHWIGSEVWGTGGNVGFTVDGSWAEYIKVPVKALSKKPTNLSFAAGATVGLPWLCADQAVNTLASVRKDDAVLIIGARGAIGSAAVQLCRSIGVQELYGTFSSKPSESPGLKAIDLSAADGSNIGAYADLLKRTVKKVNVVIDAYGSDFDAHLLNASLDVLTPGGRVVVMAVHSKSGVSCLNLRKFYAKSLVLYGLSSGQVTQEMGARLLDRLAPGFETGIFSNESKPMALVRFSDEQKVHDGLKAVYEKTGKEKYVVTFDSE
ncbi:uncharacterized protein SPPG_00005 [Spizellomyces punctatus DAOM BR117]|uniref:Enoyl reductase (ER) domain-containing protein n=1 Tax=Spizellomyces punctatus (strain DAOM BR117) TaxID=645134 RepID=A0A0L0HTS8_SPIPD|nr:uncharacterized protein SPPG_00005 [Spizellomyces punctatus DAOM BR117]KND04269.1 hypothetical protein SPPG_00005 [Spizellomyces punctatus DAOM BR117]|eukprot:XP_016612308.1 hypothetical protein SPPG_00005 [Spizellomyces punctatus DAOM BR117]